MGDDDHRHPFLLVELSEKSEDLLPALLVQVSRRLICKDERWAVDESPCYGDPLLLAAAEAAGPMLQAMPKPHLLQPGPCA